MSIASGLQELKDFIDENPSNLTNDNLERLLEVYQRMKKKYNV